MKKPKGQGQELVTTISTRNVLYGNKCVHDFTQSMGFEYHVETKMEKEQSTAWSRYWGNKAAKIKITLKNGPFWQARVRRKVNECRVKTGDHLW